MNGKQKENKLKQNEKEKNLYPKWRCIEIGDTINRFDRVVFFGEKKL